MGQVRAKDVNLSLEECRRISMERFGLSVEATDYNILRILDLVRRATGAAAALFSIPVRGGAAIVAAAGVDVQKPANASLGCSLVLDTGQTISVSELDEVSWKLGCMSLRGVALCAYFGMPVLQSGKGVLGVLSLFYNNPDIDPEAIDTKLVNDYVRLIEDSLAMREQSIRDPLTQLFNRRHMDRQAESEWRRAVRSQSHFSVGLMQVDDFEAYVDVAGHQAGDRILLKVAELLQRHCRRASDALCRYNGGRFSALLPMTDAEQMQRICEQLREGFAALNIPHPGRSGATLSLTVGYTSRFVTTAMRGEGVEACFREAETALRLASAEGPNQIFAFDPSRATESLANLL